MKISGFPGFFCVFSTLIAVSGGRPSPDILAAAPGQESPISIIKDDRSPPMKSGEYSYSIVLTDGTMLKQVGTLSEMLKGQADPDFEPFLVISGEYSYIDPLGKSHRVSYVADKNGFRPIIDGGAGIGDQISPSTPIPLESSPRTVASSASGNQTLIEPLKTISSSLFSSPSRFF